MIQKPAVCGVIGVLLSYDFGSYLQSSVSNDILKGVEEIILIPRGIWDWQREETYMHFFIDT